MQALAEDPPPMASNNCNFERKENESTASIGITQHSTLVGLKRQGRSNLLKRRFGTVKPFTRHGAKAANIETYTG
jgi:hypothetical protein